MSGHRAPDPLTAGKAAAHGVSMAASPCPHCGQQQKRRFARWIRQVVQDIIKGIPAGWDYIWLGRWP